MNIDLNKSVATNHVRLTLNIDGLAQSIAFKSGGHTASPVAVKASAAGGMIKEGLYDEWHIKGEVTVSKDMAMWLLKAYHQRDKAQSFSAIYELYSTGDNMVIKHTFHNVTIRQLPHFAIDELGAKVSMNIAFSLNDYVSTQVIDAGNTV